MIVARTRAELATARANLTGTIAVVMTMGALHAGHEELIQTAGRRAFRGRPALPPHLRGTTLGQPRDGLIVTIFVNPLQFGPGEDFDRYPRTLDADLEICERNEVDVVFAPSVEEMYPGGEPMVRVTPGPLGEVLEGATRPGFFGGVLTVVNKLLHLTRPNIAVFGEKDYQQLALVRRLVRDTNLDVEIVGVPIVREPDRLASSSRNQYLSPKERQAALILSETLNAAAGEADIGASADDVLRGARRHFERWSADIVRLDYLVLTDPDLGPAPEHGPARMLIAAWVGTTRLIDNAPLQLA